MTGDQESFRADGTPSWSDYLEDLERSQSADYSARVTEAGQAARRRLLGELDRGEA